MAKKATFQNTNVDDTLVIAGNRDLLFTVTNKDRTIILAQIFPQGADKILHQDEFDESDYYHYAEGTL